MSGVQEKRILYNVLGVRDVIGIRKYLVGKKMKLTKFFQAENITFELLEVDKDYVCRGFEHISNEYEQVLASCFKNIEVSE